MIIDDVEYVCEECGCIYGIDKLIFDSSEMEMVCVDSEPKLDELNLLLESVIPGLAKTHKIMLKRPLATYHCPVCTRFVCIPDRRSKRSN